MLTPFEVHYDMIILHLTLSFCVAGLKKNGAILALSWTALVSTSFKKTVLTSGRFTVCTFETHIFFNFRKVYVIFRLTFFKQLFLCFEHLTITDFKR